MEKEFVPYELAVKLKALGFDEHCFGVFYSSEDKVVKVLPSDVFNEKAFIEKGFLKAPTFSQAFRWFRENYNLHSVVSFDKFIDENNDVELDNPYFTYYYSINELWNNTKDYNKFLRGFMNVASSRDIMSHKEAELVCLKKLIEIVESKQKEDDK